MSTPDIYTSAAQFFLLAEQASCLMSYSLERFWEMAGMAMSPVCDPTAHLPALAAIVRKAGNSSYISHILPNLAIHPLPRVLPPEAVPWHTHLVETWKIQWTSRNEMRKSSARQALVRLDGCAMPDGMERPSHLPEWLAEAWRMMSGKWQMAKGDYRTEKLKVLAVLADWRPARGVITQPETLREWVTFWQERYRSRDPILKGIAAKALLNLPEADLRAASIRLAPPEQYLRKLTAAIPAAAERAAWSYYDNHLLMLDWQPVNRTAWPVAETMKVAQAWLEIALQREWWSREKAWRQLIRWDQTGSLAIYGIDLLPFLAKAILTKAWEGAMWEMAQWTPVRQAFTPPDGLELLHKLETFWQQQRQAGEWQCLVRASAWLAGIRLRQAGLATESPESFGEAYLSAVAHECSEETLLVLVQWSPDATFSAAFHQKWHDLWQGLQKDENKKQVAEFALLRQVLERGDVDQLRCLALEGWRTGTKKAIETPLVFITSRIHEARAALAAGSVPDFDFEVGSTLPDGRPFPQLVLPPGHITNREWRIENEELKMENVKNVENVENREVMQKMANHPAMHGLSR